MTEPRPAPAQVPASRLGAIIGFACAIVVAIVVAILNHQTDAEKPPASPPGSGQVVAPMPMHASAPAQATAPGAAATTSSSSAPARKSPSHPATGAHAAAATTQATADTLAVAHGKPISAPDEVREIRRTLAAIAKGPPYPFRRDGIPFENRERRLPQRPSGYYQEFTVVTPGSDDRGARRLIRGREGEFWYSNDHYRSFVRLAEQP